MVDLYRTKYQSVIAIFAITCSLCAHFVILRVIPPIPIGHPTGTVPQLPLAPLTLQDVRTADLNTEQRPPVFHPTDPSLFTDEAQVPHLVENVLNGQASLDRMISKLPLKGQQEAVGDPAVLSTRAPWQPRQEIVAIEKKLFSDAVSVLPRSTILPVSRVVNAPNVVLPAAFDDRIFGKASVGTVLGGSLLSSGERILREEVRLEGVATNLSVADPAEPVLFEERGSLLDEPAEIVSSFKPIERMLELDASTYLPPHDTNTVYFKIILRRRSGATLPVLPKDVVYVQDCSESMTKRKLAQCKKGLVRAFSLLNPSDRFNIIRFSEDTVLCFDQWMESGVHAEEQAERCVNGFRAKGGTDVYGSLKELMSLPLQKDRPVLAVFLTDGRPTQGLVDSSEIIEQFTQLNRGQISVFAFGGGRRVNGYLLDLLSFKNRGDSLVVKHRKEIPHRFESFVKQLNRPVLVDLTYRFSGEDVGEVYPKKLSHLYLDRPLVLYGKASGPILHVAVQVVGVSRGDEYDMVYPVDLTLAQEGDTSLPREWAWQKVHHLIGRFTESGDAALLDSIAGIEQEFGFQVPYGGVYPTRY